MRNGASLERENAALSIKTYQAPTRNGWLKESVPRLDDTSNPHKEQNSLRVQNRGAVQFIQFQLISLFHGTNYYFGTTKRVVVEREFNNVI